MFDANRGMPELKETRCQRVGERGDELVPQSGWHVEKNLSGMIKIRGRQEGARDGQRKGAELILE